MTEWQPIETAPAEVKAYYEVVGSHRGSFHTLADGRLVVTWHGDNKSETPTHWMELPRPPEVMS